MEEEQTTFEKETSLLQQLKEANIRHPKKLRKYVEKIWPEQPLFIQRGILTNLIRSKDPFEYLDRCFKMAEEYPVIIQQFIQDGKHGMMVHNDVVYPIEIKTMKKWLDANDRWSMEDEEDIKEEYGLLWMQERGLKTFEGRMMLFKEFGFSGLLQLIRLPRKKRPQ